MFRYITIAGLVLVIAIIATHRIVASPRKPKGKQSYNPLRALVYLLTLLLLPQRLGFFGRIRKLLYLLALLCFIILAVTGFYPALVLNQRLSGYLLMIHVTAGGVFAACLALLALMWADLCRFDKFDLKWITGLFCHTEEYQAKNTHTRLFPKLIFWLILIAALPLILSVVLSMFPMFGTEWQILSAGIHRYSALAFAVLAVLHIYMLAILSRE
ncbi:MAG TPA: hypothetical protein HPP87_13405 [Planctomycetes bacterium]|nr:hypothetical protein [Planctomycetota bacterium]